MDIHTHKHLDTQRHRHTHMYTHTRTHTHSLTHTHMYTHLTHMGNVTCQRRPQSDRIFTLNLGLVTESCRLGLSVLILHAESDDSSHLSPCWDRVHFLLRKEACNGGASVWKSGTGTDFSKEVNKDQALRSTRNSVVDRFINSSVFSENWKRTRWDGFLSHQTVQQNLG